MQPHTHDVDTHVAHAVKWDSSLHMVKIWVPGIHSPIYNGGQNFKIEQILGYVMTFGVLKSMKMDKLAFKVWGLSLVKCQLGQKSSKLQEHAKSLGY